MALQHRIAGVQRAGLQDHAAPERCVVQVAIAVERHRADARDPARVNVDAHGDDVRGIGTWHRRVHADVAVALVPHCGAQAREGGIQRDEAQRLSRTHRDGVGQLQRRQHRNTLRDGERPDRRRHSFDDAELDRRATGERGEDGVHPGLAKSALPVVDTQCGDVLAKGGRCGAAAVDDDL